MCLIFAINKIVRIIYMYISVKVLSYDVSGERYTVHALFVQSCSLLMAEDLTNPWERG